MVATIAGGGAVMTAMVLVAATATDRAERRRSRAVAAISGVLVVVFRLSWGTSIYGLIERVLLGVATTWTAGLAMRGVPGRS